jgi:hypothetical protein
VLYQGHLRSLKLQGKSQKTIDSYARAVRRITEHFDCCPDKLTLEQHSCPTTTVRYTHLTDTAEQHATDTINGLINTLHVELRRI